MKGCKVNAIMVESVDQVKCKNTLKVEGSEKGAYRHRKHDAYWMV